MKEARHNEIDLLLRKLGTEPSGSATEMQHLDVDELSAYAENALPMSARQRCTEHLADCSRCRKIVSGLTQAAGVTIREKEELKTETSSWRKYFAAFLSPVFLRYAVPAILGVAILSIGLIVFRQQRSDRDLVSQNVQQEPVTLAERTAPQASGDNTSTLQDQQQAQRDSVKKENQPSQAKASPEATTARADQSGQEAKEKQDKPAPPPAAAPTQAVAAAAAKPTVVSNEVQTRSEDEQKKRVARVAEEPAPKTEVRTAAADTAERNQNAAGAGRSVGAIAPVARRARPPLRKDQSEARSVAGHRFHKDGDVWVDDAYDSSRSPINVVRDSEQYRALVADEPGIKTIADELDGEVIVVWKGRAYRIR